MRTTTFDALGTARDPEVTGTGHKQADVVDPNP